MRLILILVTLLYGCGTKKFYDIEMCRVPNAVRCGQLQQVEMCGPNGHWMVVMKCRDLGNWQCSQTLDTAQCRQIP